jgi:dienelactone hydrolase
MPACATSRVIPRLFAGLAIGVLTLLLALDASAAPDESEIVLREGLAIRSSGRSARTAFHTDAIEALFVAGRWSAPVAGATVTMPNGTNRVWEPVVAKADGSFTNAALRGGYVYLPYVSAIDEVLLLKASGHSMVYVNGEPRTGDPYGNGSVALPVQVRRGTNEFLFASGRGSLRVRLAKAAKPIVIDLRDSTLPDLITGERNDVWGAVLVVNSTTNRIEHLMLTASGKGARTTSTGLPAIPPLATRKVGFQIRHSGKANTNRIELNLTLAHRPAGRTLIEDTTKVSLRLRRPDQTRRETFISRIDGSVQYYALNPAQPLTKNHPPLALVMSTHGASVEAQGQADSYAPKTWAHLVAPTNRRPYGFDWEDWGRMDALEVLDLAQRKLGTDPSRTYLTGHSMGGHGTWQLGATFPDRFAALAPSAGWISFFSYGGGRRTESTNALQQLIQRAATPSDTLVLASNYLHHGIYILHGDADDNVPVSEARAMRDVLEKFHRDFAWHEQPGAGHWWGNACVDWPPIFDLFARRKIPERESVTRVHFTTANPGISSSSHWVSIEAQQRDLGPSTVDANWEPGRRRFKAATENVTRLAFNLDHVKPGAALAVELDGQKFTNITITAEQKIWFTQTNGNWVQSNRPSLALKGPHRYGPFKEAFQHRMIFVYGTRGTAEENAWALAKARYDAEVFWYRGNGSIDVMPDVKFDASKERDRGVILYGHAESNGAWKALLGDSPVQVRRGGVRIGEREITGDDISCLFLQPRPGSDIACVAVVGGTGPKGLRLTDRVPYFLAGVAFPDCTVFGPEVLQQGAEGARVAGFFGEDWSVKNGEFNWRD